MANDSMIFLSRIMYYDDPACPIPYLDILLKKLQPLTAGTTPMILPDTKGANEIFYKPLLLS